MSGCSSGVLAGVTSYSSSPSARSGATLACVGDVRQERRPLAARGRGRRLRTRADEPQHQEPAPQPPPRTSRRPRAPPPRDPHDRSRRRRPVRLDRPAVRGPRRLRRELHPDRGPVAELPHDRAGRRARLRPVAGARPRDAAPPATRAACSRCARDLRDRRDKRSAASTGRRGLAGSRATSSSSFSVAPRRARPRREVRRLHAVRELVEHVRRPALSSPTPAWVPSWSRSPTGSARSLSRACAFGEAVDDHQLDCRAALCRGGPGPLVEVASPRLPRRSTHDGRRRPRARRRLALVGGASKR